MGRVVLHSYPMRGYDYLAGWRLPTCNHPVEWLQTKEADMVDFKGKGNPAPQYGREFQHLQDEDGLEKEGVDAESPIATDLQDMIGDDPKAIFSHHIDLVWQAKLPQFGDSSTAFWQETSFMAVEMGRGN